MSATSFGKRSIALLSLFYLNACNETTEFSERASVRPADAEVNARPEIAQEFSTGGFAITDEFAFAASKTLLVKDIKLEDVYSDRILEFSQNDRAPQTRMYMQGASDLYNQAFKQGEQSGVLDIQIVIDNSGSMSEEQTNLATKLSALLTAISKADWRINVTTTDPANPCSRGLIKKGQASAASAFATAVTAGTSGSANEQGVLRAAQGLDCKSTGADWLRPNSSLAILWVTDEDNCSNGSGCAGTLGADPNYIRNVVAAKGRTVGVDARFYGIYWIPGSTCSTGGNQANKYHSLVLGSNGAAGSICSSDYSATLQAISRNISATLRSQFVLQATPIPGSLVVKVNGTAKTTGFSVSGTTLTFTDTPPANATIDISYLAAREPQLTEFALGEVPAADTLSILVNNQEVKSGFKLVTNPDRVVFDAPPPSSADILINFRSNTALLSEFPLGDINPTEGSLKVMGNGQEMNNYTYDAAAKMIRFATAPADNMRIKAMWKNMDGPQLTYPIAKVSANPKNLIAFDKDTKAAVRFELKDGNLVLAPDEHQVGRTLSATYETDESYKSEVRLAHKPIEGSVVFNEAPETCTLGSGISVNDDTLEVNCDLSDVSTFSGRYQYNHDIIWAFALKGVTDPGQGAWYVTVNEERRTDFKRDGSTVMFDPKTLPPQARVIVRFTPGEQ